MSAPLRLTVVALAIGYPFLAHAAAATGSPRLTVLAAALLAALSLAPGLAARKPLAIAVAPIAALALWALARADAAQLPLFLPPVLINAYLAWMFGHTLLAGRVPLLERVVRLVHGDREIDRRIPSYARRLTAVWTALFIAVAAVNLALALLARPGGLLLSFGVHPAITVPFEWWSLFANLLNYLLVGALFALEYVVRRRVFPQQPYRNFAEFIQRLVAVGPRLWREIRAET